MTTSNPLRVTSDRATAFDGGFDEHLVEPVHPERLVALLGKTDEA